VYEDGVVVNVDKVDVYLEPTTAYAVAQDLAQKTQESLTVSPQTLWKRFRERGLLKSVDQTRQTNKVRLTLDGKRRDVLHLHANTFLS
jgi:DNA-binding PadR family transcriptional regulator